jgi:hypothetical protein
MTTNTRVLVGILAHGKYNVFLIPRAPKNKDDLAQTFGVPCVTCNPSEPPRQAAIRFLQTLGVDIPQSSLDSVDLKRVANNVYMAHLTLPPSIDPQSLTILKDKTPVIWRPFASLHRSVESGELLYCLVPSPSDGQDGITANPM